MRIIINLTIDHEGSQIIKEIKVKYLTAQVSNGIWIEVYHSTIGELCQSFDVFHTVIYKQLDR